jgi:hypothetical protein
MGCVGMGMWFTHVEPDPSGPDPQPFPSSIILKSSPLHFNIHTIARHGQGLIELNDTDRNQILGQERDPLSPSPSPHFIKDQANSISI